MHAQRTHATQRIEQIPGSAMTGDAAPPAKRHRLRDPQHEPTNERLHCALSSGVFRFMALEDAAAVLLTCRLLRTDAQFVAACVRALPDFSPMLRAFRDPTASLIPIPFALREQWVNELADVAPDYPAQVLSTVAFLKKRVLRWCFVYNPRNADEDDDVLCSVRPVLIPLSQLSVMKENLKWSRKQITDALNTVCGGGGDAFFDKKSAAESRFATHWDSICIDRVSGRVSCRLCDAVRDSLALYKRQVALGLRQYALMLRIVEKQWNESSSTSPEEVLKLKHAFEAKYFPADAYIRPECLAWPEHQLLRHICEHGSFQAWQVGDTRARGISSVDALLRAVSFKYQHQCRTFYQPLKKILHRKCHVVGRIPHATLQNLRVRGPLAAREDDDVNGTHTTLTELVGGVEASSGIFAGVQVTFRLTR